MADSRGQIEARVRAFAAELEQLIRQAAIEAVAQTLGGAAPVRRGPGRPPKGLGGGSGGAPRLAGARGRRSPQQMQKTIDALLGYIKSHPGQRMEQIAAALGTTSTRLNRPITKLLSDRTVKRQGQKRASKYFPLK